MTIVAGLVEDPRLGIRLELHTPVVLLKSSVSQDMPLGKLSQAPVNNGNKSTLIRLLYGSNQVMSI